MMTSAEKYLGKVASVLVGIVVISAAVQSGLIGGNASAEETPVTTTATATVSVGSACLLSADITTPHTAELVPGVYSGTYNNGTNVPYANGIGSTTLTAICNDNAGYAIYAVGYTNDTIGTTTMVGVNTGSTIAAGTATSGDTSNWAMKLAKVTDTSVSHNPNNLTIVNSFDDYHAVPSTYTKVANYTSSTDATKGSKLTTTYAAYIQPAQVADTYIGQVKYTLVHPNTNDPNSFVVKFGANGGTGTMNSQKITRGQATALTSNSFTAPTGKTFIGWNTAPDGSGTSYTNGEQVTNLADAGDTITLYAQWGTLYDVVASMSKGKQTAAQLQAAITVPTSADRLQDTSNSGVYEYDPAVFGTASDASNDYKIYYYRGVLENSTSSYGSNGSAVTYPNYVILQSGSSKATTDTCWRIVRTTGSGGVKMIYNGKWTGSTCANATTSAQAAAGPFNNSSSTVGGKSYTGIQYRNMHAVGYTYSNVAAGTATATVLSTLLGSSGNDTTTNSNSSIIKQYVEDWYALNINSYTSTLEPSAGYCNDRTVYQDGSYALADKLTDSATVIPFGISSATVPVYYFGAYTRNTNIAQTPTLNCPRGIVDLYSTTTASGGNGQLIEPTALITADEASFAGSGSSNGNNGSSSYAKSYLNTGTSFWLLSPNYRGQSSGTVVYMSYTTGSIGGDLASSSYGVRPVASLVYDTKVSGGSGVATDPWVVMAP